MTMRNWAKMRLGFMVFAFQADQMKFETVACVWLRLAVVIL